MRQDKVDIPWVFQFPPAVYLLAWALGFGIETVLATRLLPQAWLQLVVGLPLVLASAFIAATAVRTMRKAGTDFDITRPATALVTGGPFRFSRNPMYLTVTVAYIGVTIAVNTIWPLLLLPLSLVAITFGVIRAEERYLEIKFGEAYRDYKRRVRRWL